MVKGKALLVITRLEDASWGGGEKHWEVRYFIQSCNQAHYQHRDAVNECFDLMEWDLIPLPNQANKLNVGDTLRAAVVYEMHYPSYENREDGDELYLTKVRVRRIQRAKR